MEHKAVRKFCIAFVLLLAAPSVAAQTDLEAKADKLRDTAMSRFEQGDKRAAIKLSQDARRVTRHLPPTSWRTIENYDDAGLYYYDAGKWKTSAHYQAIAVLLACGVPEVQSMLPAYVERLGWAFSKYRPNEDFGLIAENPLVLLKDVRLNMRGNFDLRRRYFKTWKVRDVPAGEPPRYIYKLRPESIPASCFPKPATALGDASLAK